MTFLLITILLSLISVRAIKSNRIESQSPWVDITVITYALLNVYVVLASAVILSIIFGG